MDDRRWSALYHGESVDELASELDDAALNPHDIRRRPEGASTPNGRRRQISSALLGA